MIKLHSYPKVNESLLVEIGVAHVGAIFLNEKHKEGGWLGEE